MTAESDRHYLRHPSASALTTGGRALFARPGEPVLASGDVDAAAAAALWEALATPMSGAELAARAAAAAGLTALVDALVARALVLRGTQDELAGWAPAPIATGTRPCPHLVLGVTGAVQAVHTPRIVGRLLGEFAERMDVILTASAQEFLHPRAVSALGAGVWTGTFGPPERGSVPHVELAESASLVLVLPATADALFRFAHGAASDLLSLVVCATRAPVVVAPSMNPAMWRHPAVRRNVGILRGDGVFVLEPGPAAAAADGGRHQVGGAGLGPDAANLAAILEGVLRLSR
jgi:hypothetical protein